MTVRLRPDVAETAVLYYAGKRVKIDEPLPVLLPPGDAEAIVLQLR